jgi:hypothetical protein
MEIKIFNYTKEYAENKNLARKIRLKILPKISKKIEVILNFDKVELTTQSFIHALISDLIRKYGAEVLDFIQFKNCNRQIIEVIKTVSVYMQESI